MEHASSLTLPLHISDLTVSYGDTIALRDVHLEIPEGVLVGIIGPNGGGKTTLIKSALGIIQKQSGNILVYGQQLAKKRHIISYIPQRKSVDWNYPITAIEVVLMGLYRHVGWIRRIGKKQRAAAMQSLELVGMHDFAHTQIGELSGGQQQRIFLARALVQDASIYFLDEPLAAVDQKTEDAIVELLQQLRDRKRTLLMVHHDLSTVHKYFDYIVLLNNTVIDAGPIDSVLHDENIQRTYGAIHNWAG